MRLRYLTSLIILIIAILLSSCRSWEWHLKQAIAKNPALLDTTERVVRIDTFFIETEPTEFQFLLERDTLKEIVYRDSLLRETVIRYKYNTINDTIYIEVDCPDQEVIEKETEKTTPCIELQPEPTLWQRLEYAAYLVGVLLLLLIIYRSIKKRSSK